MRSKKHSHINSWKLKVRCREISNSRHKILTCLLSVTARDLVDFLILSVRVLWTNGTGKSSYSCGRLALVPKEPVYVKYLCPANHFGIPRNCSGENITNDRIPSKKILLFWIDEIKNWNQMKNQMFVQSWSIKVSSTNFVWKYVFF